MIRDVEEARATLPVLFVPHGGGPWPFAELGFPRDEVDGLAAHLSDLRAALPSRPRALLVVSAHWEEPAPTVTTHPSPSLLYDYYGFPPATYQLSWPAPGNPPTSSATPSGTSRRRRRATCRAWRC